MVLGERDVQSVLLEGGPRLAAGAFDAGAIDKIVCFVAPVVAGGETAPGPLPSAGCDSMDDARRLQEVTVRRYGEDVLLTGYLGEAY
jgi:diaminohydroxyphosphoribosylaminopyrimidine deaminase/5-amino-6-(5-phosphoribosylamino)uracil reductase